MKLQTTYETGNKQEISKDTSDLLNSYLVGTTESLYSTKSVKSRFKESDQVKGLVKELQNSPDALRAVESKEKDLKAQAASSGVGVKFVHAFRPRQSENSPYGLAPVAWGMAAHFFAQAAQTSPDGVGTCLAMAAGICGTLAAVRAANVAAYVMEDVYSATGNKYDEYKKVKKEQLALRLLKRELTKEGTVSGEQYRADKKAKKESFWKGVSEMYARFGNSGGGMTHDDFAGKAVSTGVRQQLASKQSR